METLEFKVLSSPVPFEQRKVGAGREKVAGRVGKMGTVRKGSRKFHAGGGSR